jgi:hypothetical protein
VNISALLQLAASTAIYVLAAGSAKSWALAPSAAKIVVTLALYTLGNLIMLRLVRIFGMSAAFSVTAVAQLVAINAGHCLRRPHPDRPGARPAMILFQYPQHCPAKRIARFLHHKTGRRFSS